MARIKHQCLSPGFVRTVKPEKKLKTYTDGNGLTLRVQTTGTKQWVLRYTINGQPFNMGLGGYPAVGLAEAREMTQKRQTTARQGINPVSEKRTARQQAKARTSVPTFQEMAAKEINRRSSAWRGDKSAKQWEGSLTNHVYPLIGNKRVDEITNDDVVEILEPIWLTNEETARRVRQRMSAVLDLARSNCWRQDNPADTFITNRLSVQPHKVENHRAIPYVEIPSAVAAIRNSTADAVTKLALEFKLLTVGRTEDIILADWRQFDLDKRVRMIPDSQMKMNRPHRVPLSERVLEILSEAGDLNGNEGLVFPSKRSVNKGNPKPLSKEAFRILLDKIEIDSSPHGLRSGFKDWASEKQPRSDMPAEFALAHIEGSTAKRAYLRTDLLETRRGLMRNWSHFAETGVTLPFEWEPAELDRLGLDT